MSDPKVFWCDMCRDYRDEGTCLYCQSSTEWVVDNDGESSDEAVRAHLTRKVEALAPVAAEIVGSGGMDDEDGSGDTPRELLRQRGIGTRSYSKEPIYIVWADASETTPIGLAGWFYQGWVDDSGEDHEREFGTDPVWFEGIRRWQNQAVAREARGRLMEGRSVDEVLGFVLGELERR
jgi:hypothetical protein